MKFRRSRVLWPVATLLFSACESAPQGTAGQEAPTTAPPSSSQPPLAEGTPVPGPPTFACDAPLGSLTIELPCQVGFPLGAQSAISAVECTVHSSNASGKVSFLVPLQQISRGLNTATDLSGFPAAPLYSIEELTLKSLGGSAVFSAVDIAGRAFLGRFAEASLTFTPGDAVCRIHDGLFWAIPGAFR